MSGEPETVCSSDRIPEKNYVMARKHFLRSYDGSSFGTMLVELHRTSGYSNEVDLFIAQTVLHGRLAAFTILCQEYQLSLERDPTYMHYLDRIGQLFFNVPPRPSRSSGLFGEELTCRVCDAYSIWRSYRSSPMLECGALRTITFRPRRLTKIYKDEEREESKWLHWSFGLSFCEPDEVGDTFCEWDLDKPDTLQNAQTYVEYLHDNAVFPPILSACESSAVTITTNACEAFHSSFNKSFNSPHSDIFRFFEELCQIQAEVYAKLQSLGNVHSPRPSFQKSQRWVDEWILRHR